MKRKIQPYIPDTLFKRFSSYCAANGASQSSVVEAALTEFLDDSKDYNLLIRRLDRNQRSLTRLDRDFSMFSEAFGVFMRIYFAHTPGVADDEKDSARDYSMKQYNGFVDHVARLLSKGHRFIDDLVQDPIANTEELAGVIEDDIDE